MAGCQWLAPPIQGLLLFILASHLCVQDHLATGEHDAVANTLVTATSKAPVVTRSKASVAATSSSSSMATINRSSSVATTSKASVASTNKASVATVNYSSLVATTSKALVATANGASVATTNKALVATTNRSSSVATMNKALVATTTKASVAGTSKAPVVTRSKASVAATSSSSSMATINRSSSVATMNKASVASTNKASVATVNNSSLVATTSKALVGTANGASMATSNTALVATTSNSSVATAANNASVATNTSVNGTEETQLTCQSFQCSGERCYQDETLANKMVTCHNETYCELYRFSSMNYTARCSSTCSTEMCRTNSSVSRQHCALDCCNSSLCLLLNAGSYGDLPPAIVPSTTTTPRLPSQNGKVCASFSCHGNGCFKGKKTVARCIVGHDFCEMKKTGLNYVAGCSKACKAAKPVCASEMNAAYYQECCPATLRASCLKLDGKVHVNSAGQVTLAPLLKLAVFGVVVLLNYRVSTSLWV